MMNKTLKNMVLGVALATAGLVQAGNRTPEPILALSPEIGDDIEIRFSYESFSGVELDEVENFDGWTAMAEASMPLMDNFRLRISYPFKTEGDATVKKDHSAMPGQNIDIDGSGGVYDYLTFTFEHQLSKLEEAGYGLGYYIGGGSVPAPLDTTLARPGTGFDAINHNGTVFFAGVKMDRQHGFGHGIANLGLRYYGASDDLNPDANDQFVVADLKVAMLFNPWGSITPVVELTYLGDFSGMNHFTLHPELVLSIGNSVDLKAGAEIGLGGNGNEFGGRAQAVFKF
jgi:hypothetical protein